VAGYYSATQQHYAAAPLAYFCSAAYMPSVGSVGDSYDNALAETINGYTKPR
jgi:hypothetical protein